MKPVESYSPVAVQPPRPGAARTVEPQPPVDQVELSAAAHSRTELAALDVSPALTTTLLPPLFGLGGLVFPDSVGRIRHMALVYGNVEFDKPLPEKTREGLRTLYTTLFQNMAPDTRFSIVCANSEGVEEIRRLVQDNNIPHPERIDILNLQSENGVSIWIRDSMLPVLMPDGTTRILVQNRTYYPGPDDNKVAPLLDQKYSNIASTSHPALVIDGGNFVSNQSGTFVGLDSVHQTTDMLKAMAQDPKRYQEIVAFYESRTGTRVVDNPARPGQVDVETMWSTLAPEVFKSEFNREIFIIGSEERPQPVFHIDMAMTPVGEKKFLVGSPRMAIEMLQALTPEEKAHWNARMAEEAGLPADSDIIGKLIEVNSGDDFQANFDHVETQLKALSYEVERIPCMIGLRTTWSLPYLTYNNSIQEIYHDGCDGSAVKKMYLPVYGCGPLDDYAVSVYERQGYQVVPLRMASISLLEGAIRCTSYALLRSHLPALASWTLA